LDYQKILFSNKSEVSNRAGNKRTGSKLETMARGIFTGKRYLYWQEVSLLARGIFTGKRYLYWQEVPLLARGIFTGKRYLYWQEVSLLARGIFTGKRYLSTNVLPLPADRNKSVRTKERSGLFWGPKE